MRTLSKIDSDARHGRRLIHGLQRAGHLPGGVRDPRVMAAKARRRTSRNGQSIHRAACYRTRRGASLRPGCIAAQLEPAGARLGTPELEQSWPIHIALGAPRAQRGKLHAPRRSIVVLRGCRLDRLAPLRECALDMARDYGNAEIVARPLNGKAGALELARQRGSVDGTRSLLRLVKLAADNGAPGAIAARCQIEDEHMRMQLRVEFPAGVMFEGRHQQPGRGLAGGPTLASPRPRSGLLQVSR